MKKSALAVCMMFVLTSLSFGGTEMYAHKGGDSKEDKEARKAKMEAVKKDHMEFQRNLDAIIERYNKADDKSKADIRNEIRALIAAQTDKEIAAKKDMLEMQKARINKLEENIADLETNKNKHIDSQVNFVTSAEGQAKMKEMKEKMENKNNDKAKKDPKKK
ncbi:MAG: hypothetical protein FWH43_06995 [Endomicrobia bacterium]|nr:hypothetical protein [Endomicrobiia bacterium]